MLWNLMTWFLLLQVIDLWSSKPTEVPKVPEFSLKAHFHDMVTADNGEQHQLAPISRQDEGREMDPMGMDCELQCNSTAKMPRIWAKPFLGRIASGAMVLSIHDSDSINGEKFFRKIESGEEQYLL